METKQVTIILNGFGEVIAVIGAIGWQQDFAGNPRLEACESTVRFTYSPRGWQDTDGGEQAELWE